MPKAPRPTSKPGSGSRKPRGTSTPQAELSPLDPAYQQRPDSELPVLSFPNSELHDVERAAELRRRVRVRNEAIFVVVLVIFGVAVLAMARNPAFLALALISAVAVVAYEVTVTVLE
jgi:hypothetical protein